MAKKQKAIGKTEGDPKTLTLVKGADIGWASSPITFQKSTHPP